MSSSDLIFKLEQETDKIDYKAMSDLRFLLMSFRLPELQPSTGEKGSDKDSILLQQYTILLRKQFSI